MNLGELRVRVKQLIHKRNTTADDDTGTPKNAEINTFINEARQRLYAQIGSRYPARYGSKTTLAYGASLEKVTLPAAAQHTPIEYIEGTYNGDVVPFRLIAVTVEEFWQMSVDGIPNYYAIIGQDIYLRPRPTQDLTLAFYHLAQLTDLSANSDTPSELPAGFHSLIAYRAALEIRSSNGDPLDDLERRYAEKEYEYISYMERIAPDSALRETAQVPWWNG